MMTSRRDGGAVHIMFLVVTLVIGLAGWGFFYKEFTENEDLVAAAQEAEASSKIAAVEFRMARDAYDDLASKVGGGVKKLEDPGGRDFEAWSDAFQDWHKPLVELRDAEVNFFKGDVSTTPTLADVFPTAESYVQAKENEIAALERARDDAVSQKNSAEQSNVTLVGQHGTALASKNDEMSALRDRLSTQLSAAEDLHAALTTEFEDLTGKHETSIAEHRQSMQDLRDKMTGLDNEVARLKASLRTTRSTQAPDGQVIEVDNASGMAWVDIGSRHFLRRGTRFKAYDVLKGGVKVDRGYLVVHDVQPFKALCSIESGVGAIEPGNQVTNPYYAREDGKQPTFYFLGSLPGRFDNQTAKNILDDFGAAVSEDLSLHVDFLVLGDNPDPEAVGEDADPIWFKKTTEYTDAVRWGIEMIRARDLATYLQY